MSTQPELDALVNSLGETIAEDARRRGIDPFTLTVNLCYHLGLVGHGRLELVAGAEAAAARLADKAGEPAPNLVL